MAGIQWAADLVGELRKTGTGQGKLDLVARAMADRFDAPEHAGKPESHPDRHLTAAEAVAVLQRHGTGEVTLEKCRQLLLTGVYAPPAERRPADKLPPPPRTSAPAREPVTGPEARVQPVAAPFSNDAGSEVGPKPVAQEEAGLARAGEKPEPVKPEPKKPAGKKVKRAAAAKKDEAPAAEPATATEGAAGSDGPDDSGLDLLTHGETEEHSDGDGSGLPDAGEGPGGPAAE
ncbi:unnamed protein product [Gemmataceae bacterium]|nr:unnamed protein product [Gemmataceae bacterium]VTT98934.1 unnamed protein product [Gemmataceae bacterium]